MRKDRSKDRCGLDIGPTLRERERQERHERLIARVLVLGLTFSSLFLTLLIASYGIKALLHSWTN